MNLIVALLYLLGAFVIVVTALPIWRTTRWWVRLCDFPRFQIALAGFAVAASLTLLSWPPTVLSGAFIGGVTAAAVWQLTWVWAYLPGSPKEVPNASRSADAPERISLLTTNVFRECRDADSLMAIIKDAGPDLILAVETDEWWCSRLSDGLASSHTYSLTYPLSTGYGMSLFSRLELVDPEIRFVVDEAVPSIKTGVRLRAGALVQLYGLHPRPPSVQQDSKERDTELIRIGMEIRRTQQPTIVLGDLNDVAWSPTTVEFKRTGGLLDPRKGRGFFNTYPAGFPGFRYPLDYVFHTRHFAICGMRVLRRFQSDHLPLIVELGLADTSRHAQD